jgi:hypothetical protein
MSEARIPGGPKRILGDHRDYASFEAQMVVAPKRANWCVENFQFNNIFDNSAARADLAFRYTVSWVEGVRRTAAWLDERSRIENSDDDPFDDRGIAAWEQLGTDMAQALADLDA